MHLPRMTIRRWMIAVAAVACGMFGLHTVQRLHAWRQFAIGRSAYHARKEAAFRRLPGVLPALIAPKADPATEVEILQFVERRFRSKLQIAPIPPNGFTALDPETLPFAGTRAERLTDSSSLRAEYLRAMSAGAVRSAEHHARLKTKYQRSARYPWLPFAADPPEPERLAEPPRGDDAPHARANR
ncbi:MAG: hypothetical protein P4L84_22015 [Isosphaeraceae bacterium]|nr:hypothetical protein [Isosphaeraceae bacterium]